MNTLDSRVSFKAATILAIFLAAPTNAADLLVLKNGDRITGEIKRIWDAEISIEPSYSDEFNVDSEVVAYIESDREFDIELADGRNVVAQPAGADDEGKQLLLVNGEPLSSSVMEFFELDEIDDAVEWDTLADLSYALNTGNTESINTKLRADSTLKINDHRHIAEITFIREEQNQISTKEQDLFSYHYNWLFNDPWFFGATAAVERDPIRELDYRVVSSAGMGRDIWNTPRLLLSAQLGAGAITENIGGSKESSTVAQWTLRYRQDLFSEDLEIYHNQSITWYLSGRDNTIYKTTTGLRYEITDLLYANFSVDFDYETQPVSSVSNEDVAIVFGVGVEL